MSLPVGTGVVLDPALLTADRGRLLVGGSPLTAVRLSATVADRVVNGRLRVEDQETSPVATRLVATNLAWPELATLPPAGADQVTVVVPVRDRAEQLERCLSSLQPLPRVVVVDDCSDDPAAVAEVARRHGAELLVLSRNVGPAGARNAGLERCRTPYVALVDSDVQVSAAVLLGLAGHLVDPQVAVVGPRVKGRARNPRPRWFERYDAQVSSLTLGRRPSTVAPGAAVAWLPSACLVARRAALGAGFTSSMRVGEDVDLVWRLVDGGHAVRYEPALTAYHDVRPTVCGWLGRKAVYGSGGAALAVRHGSRVAPAVLSPATSVAAAALLTRRWWAAPVALAAVAHGGWRVHRALPRPASTPSGRVVLATRVAARGLGWALRQESALLLRHWWPATATAAACSPAVRRAVVTALLVDGAVGLGARAADDEVGPLVVLAGRRLDDLAYGAGLWWGALRQRSARCLCPRSARLRPGGSTSQRGGLGQVAD